MRLVHNWNCIHRAYSVQAPALAVAVLLTWQAVPDDLKSVAPGWLKLTALILLLLGGIAGRYVEQPNVGTGPDSGRVNG